MAHVKLSVGLENFVKHGGEITRRALVDAIAQLTEVGVLVSKHYAVGGRPLHLRKQTGAYQNAIYGVARQLVGEVGFPAGFKYGRIHEEGGYITPNQAGHLAIPLTDWRDSPTNHSNLVPIPTRNARIPWALREKGTTITRYLLARWVYIPKRPTFGAAAAATATQVEEVVGKHVTAQVVKLGGRY